MTEPTPHVRRLRAALTGPPPSDRRFLPGLDEIRRLTPAELGALLPLVHRVIADEESPDPLHWLARAVQQEGGAPEFTAATCAELFAVLAERPKRTDVTLAAAALLRCAEPWDVSALAGPATVLVRAALDGGAALGREAELLAVAGLAGPASEAEAAATLRAALADRPLTRIACEALIATGVRERALLAEDLRWTHLSAWPRLPDSAQAADDQAWYVEGARRVMTEAAAHLAALHRGEVEYAADTTFAGPDAETLRRATCLALRRDEPWAGGLLAEILPKVTVAPTPAKTLPSQSVCIALAQTVEELPTPEAVDALREARRLVRHAGVTKKLDRILRRAEKNLGKRPEVALRLPDLGIDVSTGRRRLPVGPYVAVVDVTADEGPVLTWERADDGTALRGTPAVARRDHPDELAAARALVGQLRTQRRTLTLALESGFVLDTTYRYGRWRAELAEHPVARAVTRRLVWEIERTPGVWHAFLPADGDGLPDADPSAAVRLWHPARTTDPAERSAWRDRIMTLALRQPLRQVFREQYAPRETGAETALFEGPLLDAGTVLGLAAREGWSIEYDQLVREFGPARVSVHLGAKVYPGMTGWLGVCGVRLDPPLGALDPVVRSEALRAVDLLVAVGTFAWWDADDVGQDRWQRLRQVHAQPLGAQARMRRDALRRILAGTEGVHVADRHLTVGDHTVHLATGRVSRDGEPVEIALPDGGPKARALPFLPYDEQLLERIVRTVEVVRAASA
ncbi:DUF4132 domain-containing protein [Streptomyces sp. VRA16 Mangrove soil]|uniref:DUF4132 domain-containing protein n=1 Tax=Streptomyces sp. VRA16 Mangrove soil TaxID=2817434 RepID=UPI001A9E9391|nr:DUF4132 domain-containing protein [Streptomyces sp. VRA16 Mangrove soil]MBO1335480.1 DUF4132 domain-containing protein [Streptomyces sp. VRA16 Mangrove soil]